MHACQVFSHVWLFMTLWTVAYQTALSMGFSRQEYQSGLPCTSSEDLPDPRIKPTSPAAPAPQVDSLPLSHQGRPRTLEWIAYPFSRGIFLTQESNWGLLQCKRILYCWVKLLKSRLDMANLCFTFWGTAILLYTKGVSFCIVFSFLHILASTCDFLSSWFLFNCFD